TDVGACVALDLELDAVVEGEQPRADARLDDQAVELEVELEDLAHERALTKNESELAVDGPQLRDERLPLRERKAGREVCGEPFEMADREVELAAVNLGHRCYGETLLAVVAQRGDEPLLTETMERTAHRRAAHPQALGDDPLGQWCPGRQLAP